MRLTKREQGYLDIYYYTIESQLKNMAYNLEITPIEKIISDGMVIIAVSRNFLEKVEKRQIESNLKYINSQLRKNFKYAESRHAGYNKRKL